MSSKKHLLFLTTTLCLSTLSVTAGESHRDSSDASQPSLAQYLLGNVPAITLGAVVGGVTGGLSGLLLKELNCVVKKFKQEQLLLALFAGSILLHEVEYRDNIVNDLHDDLDDAGIASNKSFMRAAAWLASWYAFLNHFSAE